MVAQKYRLKASEPGSGVPRAWRTRPSAEHPEGQVVTAEQAGTFDLDEYFPPGVPGNGRDWFDVADAASLAAAAPSGAKKGK